MAIRSIRDDDVDLERDRILVERCQAGESEAFDLLYLRYFERLKRFCLRRVGDPHEAEDAAQDAFARAWKALPGFGGDRRFYPWLSVIAANLCTDILRKRSRNTPVPDNDLDHIGTAMGMRSATEEEGIFDADDARMATEALQRISPRHREVLLQREGAEWSYQQIADYHGVRITTVEALIWRARRSLRREFMELSGSRVSLGIASTIGIAWRRLVVRLHRTAATPARASAAHTGRLAAFHLSPAAGGLIAAAGASAIVAVSGLTGHLFAGSPQHSAAPTLASASTSPGHSGSGGGASGTSGGSHSPGSGGPASASQPVGTPGASGATGAVTSTASTVLGGLGTQPGSVPGTGSGADHYLGSPGGDPGSFLEGGSSLVSGLSGLPIAVAVPPITIPPVTVPVVAIPPVSVPVTAVPPVMVPPVTVPPVTVPPVTFPPATVPTPLPTTSVAAPVTVPISLPPVPSAGTTGDSGSGSSPAPTSNPLPVGLPGL